MPFATQTRREHAYQFLPQASPLDAVVRFSLDFSPCQNPAVAVDVKVRRRYVRKCRMLRLIRMF